MYRLWLVFAQAATIAVAVLFVVSTFRPEWLPARSGALPMLPSTTSAPAPAGGAAMSYYGAVQRAMPSVVNIFTSKEIRSPRHPLLNDPIFRRFFGEQMPEDAQRASSLGSGAIAGNTASAPPNPHAVEAADQIAGALPDGKK